MIPHLEILNLNASVKNLLPHKITFRASGNWDVDICFGGDHHSLCHSGYGDLFALLFQDFPQTALTLTGAAQSEPEGLGGISPISSGPIRCLLRRFSNGETIQRRPTHSKLHWA